MIKIARRKSLILAIAVPVGLVSLLLTVAMLRSSDDGSLRTSGGTSPTGDAVGGTSISPAPGSGGSPGASPTETDGGGASPTGGAGVTTPSVVGGARPVVGAPLTPGPGGSTGTSAPVGPAQPTTTSAPPVTPTTTAPVPPIPPPVNGAIGYVGCSLTRSAVQGYHEVGGTRFWPSAQDYSGGTIERWADNLSNVSRYWATFNGMYQATPSNVIWWQLCTFSDSSDASNYTDALAVLQEIGRRIPGVTVYVSAQNGWEAPHVCDLTGPDGLARMQALRNRLVGENRARLGPDVGDVPRSQIAPDGCHPNDEGRKLLGSRLAAFGF